MPSIERLEQNYQNNGLKILMVNMQESKERVDSYIRRNDYTFSVPLDSTGSVSQKYSVVGIPTALLIDKHGKLVYRSMGYRNWNTKKIHEAIDSLISE